METQKGTVMSSLLELTKFFIPFLLHGRRRRQEDEGEGKGEHKGEEKEEEIMGKCIFKHVDT